MKQVVKLKYSMGDMVSVRKPSSEECNTYDLRYSKWVWETIPEEENRYFVDGYHITFEEDKEPVITYIFHSYLNKYIEYHDHIPECLLTPITENRPHEVEVEAKDVFGDEINFGDQVYYGLYQSKNEGVEATPTMSFINGGNVYKITYGKNDHWNNGIYVYYYNNFLTVDKDGKDYKDARRAGDSKYEMISCICKTVPETFYEDIINNAWDKFNYLNDKYDSFTFKCVMEHFGQYDVAYEYLKKLENKKEKAKAYRQKKKVQSKPKKTQAENTLSVMKDKIANLSDKDKEELLKMLMS